MSANCLITGVFLSVTQSVLGLAVDVCSRKSVSPARLRIRKLLPLPSWGGGSEVNLLRALTEGGQSVSKDVTGTQRGRSWVIALGGCIGAENASCPLLRRSFWFARGLQINNPKFDVAEARVRYWWLGRKSCSRSDQWSQCRLGLGVSEWQSDMQLSGTALCQEGGMSF